MKVLVTSGGTKVPIDSVRDITNLSNGTFGAKLAKELLTRDHEVHFFCARHSRTPFKFECDFWREHIPPDTYLAHSEWCRLHLRQYKQSEFRNYSDYRDGLRPLIEEQSPDVVLLAAAVSDYITDGVDGKIRSQDQMSIQFRPAEKLISQVKIWKPSVFLVGFKLLVGATKEELTNAAKLSVHVNGCDLVIANDLNTLKAGCHEVLLITGYSEELVQAKQVERIVDVIQELARCET
tara:strand:- start:38 stop:745 length:708 start_codon:yes stop_codon:yes gene_type:complete